MTRAYSVGAESPEELGSPRVAAARIGVGATESEPDTTGWRRGEKDSEIRGDLGLTFRRALLLALLRLRWRCGHRLLPQVLNDAVSGPVGETVEAVTDWNLAGEEVAEVHHPFARPIDKDESRHMMIVPGFLPDT